MAYTPTNWVCGDTITAEKLNKLENGLAECCGGGDAGYSCSEEWVMLTEESVTTAVIEGDPFAVGNFTYSELITADTIKVTFNGAEYTCDKISAPIGNAYGANGELGFDLSEYPFAILSFSDPFGVHNNFYTETAGTYSIKIETLEEIVETSECFNKAVHSISEPLKVSINNEDSSFDKTWQEIHDAFPNVYVEDQTGGNTNHYAITAVEVRPNDPRPYSIVFASSPSSVYTALTPTSYPVVSDR